MKIQENMEVELVAQKDFYILSISIYKVLQLDDENRNMDMKLFLEETFANNQKLIENSNAVAKKVKEKLTIVDVENSGYVSASSSSTPLSIASFDFFLAVSFVTVLFAFVWLFFPAFVFLFFTFFFLFVTPDEVDA